MNAVALSVLGLLFSADPAPAKSVEPEEIHQVVQKSLGFLESETVQWMAAKKCAACHHAPFLLRAAHLAKSHGYAVNETTQREVEAASLKQYLGHPTFQPTGMDQAFLQKPFGGGTVYLTLALNDDPARGEQPETGFQKLTDNFFQQQNDDGSWTTKKNTPPLIDSADAVTMLILLATSSGGPEVKHKAAREKAWAWIKENPARDENQSRALRVMAAQQFGDRNLVEKGVAELRSRQGEAGGWRQKEELDPDALATGQSLLALHAAGVPSTDPAIRNAWSFLAGTQREDGSWLVHTRYAAGHDPIISYAGTGWATMGLIKTAPKERAAGQ